MGTAKLLRGIQHVLDKIFRQDRCLYRLLYGRHMPHLLGTMLLECFGVPLMAWYSEREMRRIFSRFEIRRLQPVGLNFPRRNGKNKGVVFLGVYVVHPPNKTDRWRSG